MQLQQQHMDRKVDKLANNNANVAGPSQDHPQAMEPPPKVLLGPSF